MCHQRFTQAEVQLNQAEHILRPSGLVQETCRLDWVWALLAEAMGDYRSGLQKVQDALLICADKGFRLWQADSLILRGRLYLMQFRQEGRNNPDLVEKAGDDGEQARSIAADTGYIWANIAALELLASYHRERATWPTVNAEDEHDLARRYAQEATSLQTGLFLTDEQMQKLDTQARDTFAQQVGGWDEAS